MSKKPKPHDATPLHLKFGYARMIERNVIRDKLREQGEYRDGYSMELDAAVHDAYCLAHANDPTYRETSARISAQATRPAIDVRLNNEEIAFLLEHFTGANDSFVISLLEKLKIIMEQK